jgi:hypothetical protein
MERKFSLRATTASYRSGWRYLLCAECGQTGEVFRLKVAAVLALATVAAPSCGSGSHGGSAEDIEYSASATVLASPDHGPQLCLGGVALSLPPQCGGPDIVGWDWNTVAGEETANGTTWGDYKVTGTYDGRRLTLTRNPGPPDAPKGMPDDHFATPCRPPEGGWAVTDETRLSDEASEEATAYARSQPTFGGTWVDSSINPKWRSGPYGYDEATAMELGNPRKLVLNFLFTKDVERHRATLRQLWGGPLCVSEAVRTSAQLGRIQKDLEKDLGSDASPILMAYADEVHGVVRVEVTVADPQLQASLDERYGEGVVVLTGALTPVKASAE